MVNGVTRIAGILAILVGFIISLTGIGIIMGVPIIIIGFISFIPELAIPLIIVGIILFVIPLLSL